MADLVAETVARTKGRISAKRLLPVAVAAGYGGSARNFRRLVAEAKSAWRSKNHRGRRPGVWAPGDMVVFDWGEIGPPVRVLCRGRLEQVSLRVLHRQPGGRRHHGGPGRVLRAHRRGSEDCAHRPHGLPEGWDGRGLVIPTPAYVRFATHYGFRPDFCEGADPESKGLVENLVGYVKSDLMIPEQLSVADLATANEKGRVWCDEVNSVVHSEIAAVPTERLEKERELFSDLPSLRAQIGKRSSPSIWSFPLVRPPSTTTTTEVRDHHRSVRSGPRAPPRRPSVPSVPWPMPSSRERRPEG